MLELEGINLWAVIVAWTISVVIGSYWYSPAGFSKQWARLSGVDIMKLPKRDTNRAIGFVIVSCLFQVITLAVILNSLDVTSLGGGIGISLVLWFGFTALTTIGTTLYQKQSLKFWWLNASYFLVVMAINGAVLAVWQ